MDLFTGQATVRLPLSLPPGTGGHTPSLALGYGSHASNQDGPLGVGWSLDLGAPTTVERSTRDGAPSYTAADGFVYGGQDLVPTANQNEFVTETFDHSRIEFVPGTGAGYWRVLRPDGTRLYYGYENAPSANPPNESVLTSILVRSTWPTPATCPDPFSQSCTNGEWIVDPLVPFAWHLDRIEDRNGNVTRYRWQSLGDTGMRYLVEIRYSGHVSGALMAVPAFGGVDDGTLSRSRNVHLLYEFTRNEAVPTYRTGFPRLVRRRLSQVVVEVDQTPVRRYRLEYEESPVSGRTRLAWLRERGPDDAPASELVHRFRYGDGVAKGWGPVDSTYALPAGLTFTVNGRDRGVRVFDVNGDGWADVVQGHSQTRRTFLGGPQGFSATPAAGWEPPADFVDATGYTGLVVADLDGDGLPDFLQRRLEVTGTVTRTGAPCGTSRQHEISTQGGFTSGAWRNDGFGWTPDPVNDRGVTPITTQPSQSGAVSCPDEYLPTAIKMAPVNARFDQATRLVDIDGDGRDDVVYRRGLQGLATGSQGGLIDEIRAGTVLNGPGGLQSGSLNVFHSGLWNDTIEFRREYPLPRWQVPTPLDGRDLDWSNFNTCHGNNKFAESYTGMEHFADLNGDGLPEIVEAGAFNSYDPWEWSLPGGVWVNIGYTWRFPNHGNEAYWTSLPPVDFFEIVLGSWTPVCGPGRATQASDQGYRLLDLNGDGGPDLLGDGLTHGYNQTPATSLVWNARERSVWRSDGAWTSPVSFAADSSGTEADVRLVDVNGDGLVDLLQSSGARLNLAEPPDKLERIESPFGAATTISYRPHTDLDTTTPPVTSNPAVNGQRTHGQAVWVVDTVTSDPGAGFGFPVVPRSYRFREAVYDIDERAFRGFRVADVRSASVEGRVRLERTWLHTRDGLAGRPAQEDVYEEQSSGSRLLVRTFHEWVTASAAQTGLSRYFGTSSLADLPAGHLQHDAFAAFRTLVGAYPEAARTHLAFPIAREERTFEGAGSPQRFRRHETTFDVYGNAIREIARGDDTIASDDVTTSRSFALLDTVVGGQRVYLADRPFQIVTSGVQGELPAGTTLSRTTDIYYDNSTTPGIVTRGNPTQVDRSWTRAGEATLLRSFRGYDVYGNLVLSSSPLDVNDPALATLRYERVHYDAASRTFPVNRSVFTDLQANSTYTTVLEYELPGCGAPPGLGLVCRVTDPTTAVVHRFYDPWGRLIREEGPNGAVLAVLHHDADRGTSTQRIEVRARWNASGPSGAAVATDSNALVQTRFYDGLLRTVREERSGQGSSVARRFTTYDAAGRLASLSRWDFAAAPVAPTLYSYDALDRVVAEVLPDGSTVARIYEPWQETEEVTATGSGLVERRRRRFDGFGRLAAVDQWEYSSSGTPATTSYRYDPFGQLAVVRDPVANDPALCSAVGASPACAGQIHERRLFYDELGNRTRLEDPDAGVATWSYDAAGLLAEQVRANGQRHSYTYDGLGRLRRVHPENPPRPEADVVLTYGASNAPDPADRGRLIRVDDDEGYELIGYDTAGNLAGHTRVLGGRRFVFFHVSDPLGRRRQTTYPDGEVVTWHYDKAHLVRIEGEGGAYDGDYLSGATYDALDRPTSLGMGGSPGAPVTLQGWSFDPVTGELDRTFANRMPGLETLADLDYTVDGIGRVHRLAATTRQATSPSALEARTFNYFYDGMRRLRTINGPVSGSPTTNFILQYRFDPIGNLREIETLTVAHAHPQKPHWPSAGDGWALEADAAGSVASRTVNATVHTFTHDSFGRPRTTADLAHGYDWTGRRVRTVRGTTAWVLEPAPGYSYEGGVVNKHFFVAGRRVAASARVWEAPAAAAPVPWAPTWQLPAPPPWAFGLAYAGALGMLLLAAARRRAGPAAPRGLRLTSVAVLATTGPTLIVGCPPSSQRVFGTFGEAALFFVTDAVGSTILAVRPDGSVRNRFLYRPYGQKIVNEGVATGGPQLLTHGFAGGAVLPTAGGALYALGPRLYDPFVGHFYQPDPLLGDPADPRSQQPYGYALGDPLRYRDPSGLQAVCDLPQGCGGPRPPIWSPFPRFPPVVVKPKPVNVATHVPRAPDVTTRHGDVLLATVLVIGQERFPDGLVDQLDEAEQIELAKLRLRIAELHGVDPAILEVAEAELREIGINLGIGPLAAAAQAVGLGASVAPGPPATVGAGALLGILQEAGPGGSIGSMTKQVAASNRRLGLSRLRSFVTRPVR